MKFYAVLLITLFAACNNQPEKKETPVAPKAPASISSVKEMIKGKNYQVTEVGTMSPFEMDKEAPYEWIGAKADSFSVKYANSLKPFELKISQDSSLSFTDEGKTISGYYTLDESVDDEEAAGIKLRIHYKGATSDMQMPGIDAESEMTSTYIVKGIDATHLLVQAPRKLNSRKVVLMMTAK